MSPSARSYRWLPGVVLVAVLASSPVGAQPEGEIPTGHGVYPVNTLVDDTSGNGNGRIDPNECVALAIQLLNTDPNAAATGVSATLATSTPGVSVITGTSAYPEIPAGGTAFNVTSFRISTSPTFGGTSVELLVTITADQATATRPLSVPTGQVFQSSGTIAIPDNDPAGAFLPVTVSGLAGALTKVVVTVHVLHGATEQLDLRLESPGGTSIDLSSDNGVGANYGSSCTAMTTFDDAATFPITAGTPPFPGGWAPEQPLATFAGLTGASLNGQWRLRVADDTAGTTGTIQCVTLRIQTDAGGPGTCRTLTIGDASVVEGHQGIRTAVFPVDLDAAAPVLVHLGFLTMDVTATAPSDYTAVSGTLTFQPGEVSKSVAVNVVGDLTDELDERFTVFLAEGSGAYVVDNQGFGTIYDDDGAGSSDRIGAVSHGSEIYTHLASWDPTTPDNDLFLIREDAYASYEVVVDAASGDVQPLTVELLGTSGTTAIPSVPVGAGPARSIRWMHDSATTPAQPVAVHVRSGGCGVDCGADDTYRLRVYETTQSIPRFNNANAQVSVVLLQAPSYAVNATLLFWSPAGALLHREQRSLAPFATLVFNTGTIPALQGAGGSVTVLNDARYGELVGKIVTLDPASGFSFDTPMTPRPR
jgi:subtilisin-like proprotein convertase family protein